MSLGAATGSQGRVLIVDDNPDILLNLRMFLEFNDFSVVSANDGKEAIEILENAKEVPDVIISDIMMPEMNGYELLKAVSTMPVLNQIPFVFLSAKSAIEDIRLGKILGADDYLTKPFNQDDLIAVIKGKIARKRRFTQFSNAIGVLTPGECNEQPTPTTENTFLIYVVWDDKIGPAARDHHPRPEPMPFNVEEIGYQLFNASSAIYGDKFAAKAEGILLSLVNIHRQAYILFDSYPDITKRAGVVLYMLAVIAPCISYLASLNIKRVLEDLTASIKSKRPFKLGEFQERAYAAISGR
ncbi:MAG: response regulator [Candidatus Lokiarchaeota archaeon]|nr:response regulator [Candidatus Lokiarchaeota archaeon]